MYCKNIMNIKQILVVAGDVAKANVLTLLNDSGKQFEPTFADSDEGAIELANRQHFDMAVIDNTNAAIDVKKLKAVLPILHSEIALVSYEGEAFSELEKKIKAAFTRKRNERIRQFLVLDSSVPTAWNGLPLFSAN